MKLLADTNLGTLQGLGSTGTVTDAASAFSKFIGVFSTAFGVLTISGGIWFIIQILGGAFQWLSSGGEKQALQNAQKRLTNAILGLFVVIFTYALIGIVGLIFGFNILCPFANIFPSGGTSGVFSQIGTTTFSCSNMVGTSGGSNNKKQ